MINRTSSITPGVIEALRSMCASRVVASPARRSKGETAALDVDGVSHANWKMHGRVLLVREAGAWKVIDTKLRVVD